MNDNVQYASFQFHLVRLKVSAPTALGSSD